MERPISRKPRAEGSSLPTMTFVGHARLPQSLTSTGSGVVCVELEVDPASGEVVGLGSQAIMPRCELLLREVLLGYNLDRGLDDALRAIQGRYVGPPQKAVCTAVAIAYEAFLRSCRHEVEASSHLGPAFLHPSSLDRDRGRPGTP